LPPVKFAYLFGLGLTVIYDTLSVEIQ
jgi:hypothetical protein